MQSLAACRFAQALKSKMPEALPQFQSRLDHGFEVHVGRGVQIKHEATGLLGAVGLEFQGCSSRAAICATAMRPSTRSICR